MRCFYTFLFLLMASLIGCRTEKLKSDPSNSSGGGKPSEVSGLVLEGRVGIGFVSRANVTVHLLVDGRADWNTEIGRGETDVSGRFEIKIDSKHAGMPGVVRVTSLPEASTLKCGLSIGCAAAVAFGDSYQLDENFEYFVVVPRLRRELPINPSVLSHIAFKMMEADSQSVAQSSPEQTISRAEFINSKIASRFGVVGNLESLVVADITNPAELPAASKQEIKNAAVNLAVLQAARKKAAENIPAALSQITEQFFAGGVPDVASSQAVVTYADVLREASAILLHMQRQHNHDLGALMSEFDSTHALISMRNSQQPSAGLGSATVGMTDVQKGKELSKGVRSFANSIDLRKLVGLSKFSQLIDGGVSDVLKAFGADAGAMDMLEDEDFDNLISALGFVGEAAFSSVVDYYADSVVRTSYEGVNFGHYLFQGSHIFDFTTDYDPCADKGSSCVATLRLGVVIRVTRFTGNAGTKTFAPDGLDFRVIGNVGAGDMRLSFPESDFQLRSIMPSISISDYAEDMWKGSEYNISVDALRIRFPFEVTKAEAMEEEKFSGALSVDLGKFKTQYTAKKLRSNEQGTEMDIASETVTRIDAMEDLKAGMAATIETQSESTFYAAINVAQGLGAIPESLILRSSVMHCAPDAVGCKEESDTRIEGEADDKFLAVNAAATFQTKLKGISSPALIQLSVSRLSPSNNSINNIFIGYPGHAVHIKGQFNNNGGINSLDATNLDGMRLYFETLGGKRRGAVTTAVNEKVADVIDMGQWVKIEYVDGRFESL